MLSADQQTFVNNNIKAIREAIKQIQKYHRYSNNNNYMDYIWVYHNQNSKFSGGVFKTRENAEAYIKKHNLTGILSRYPIDILVYEWAIKEGFFEIKKEEHKSSHFIGGFTSGSMEHYHYENGLLD